MKSPTLPHRLFLFALLLLITWQWYERRVWSQVKDSSQSSLTPAGLPKLVVQLGHSGSVSHAAFSSDGRLAVTVGEALDFASKRKEIIVWSVSTGREIRQFELESGADSVEFAPKGSTLLIGERGLWSAETGTELGSFSATAAEFSPDGRFLLTDKEGVLVLRSALTANEIRRFAEPAGFKSFAFSPDSRFVLIVREDKTATLVNVETGDAVGHFTGDEARFSPDGRFVITSKEGTVLWNVATAKEERRFDGEAAHVSSSGQLIITADSHGSVLREISSGAEVRRFAGRSPEFSPDDRLVVTHDGQGPAIFDRATGRELYHFDTTVDAVDGLTFSSDGRFFLTRGDGNHKDNEVSVWDAVKIRPNRQFHAYNTTSAVFSPDGSYVLTGDQDSVAHLWDSATGLEIRRFEGNALTVTSAKFVKQGQFLETNSAKVSTEQGSENPTIKLLALAAGEWEIATGQQRRYYQGLPDTVYSAAVSPDGRFVVTGGEQAAHLWEVASKRELRTFEGHTGPVVSVVVSFDGRTILTGSKDGTARLWEAATGKELKRFVGHADELVGASMSKDGRFVLTSSQDGTVRLWDARTAQELRRFGERKTGVVSLVLCSALSPDGRFALTGNVEASDLKDEGIHLAILWDTATGKELRRFAHPEFVHSVAFSPDSTFILTGCLDTNVRLWNRADGNLVRSFKGFSTGLSVAFSPDGHFILTSGAELTQPNKQSRGFRACLWNAVTGQVVKTFVNPTQDLTPAVFTWAASFSADGLSIITVSLKMNDLADLRENSMARQKVSAMPGMAQLWNTHTGKEVSHFGRDAGDPQAIKFSPDGSTVLISRKVRNSLQVLDAETGRELQSLVAGPESIVTDMTYSPDGRLILAGTAAGSYLWDTQTGKLLHRFSELSPSAAEWDAAITSVHFSSDNQTVSIIVKGEVFFCDVQTGGFLKIMPGFPGEQQEKGPTSLALSPDGELIAQFSEAGTLRLFDTVGTEPLEFKGHTKKITSVAFSANNNFVASASEDHTVRLWDAATAKQLQVLHHPGAVGIVAFSSNGRSLLTVSDRIARLWDTATGNMFRQFKQDEAITAAALSKNARLLVTGGESGNIYLLNAVTGATLRTLKGHTEKAATLAFTPDSRFLVSRNEDKSVHLWDVTRGTEIPRFTGLKKNVTSMSLSANGNWLVTSGEDKIVRLLDLSTGQEIRRLTNHGDIVSSVAFSPDGRFILTGSTEIRMTQEALGGDRDAADGGGNARLWNVSTRKLERSFGKDSTTYVEFSPDAKQVLTASSITQWGHDVILTADIWATTTDSAKPLHHFDFGEPDGTTAVTISPDGRSVLSGTIYDGDEEIGHQAHLLGKDKEDKDVESVKFMGDPPVVNTVAFSPDGRFMVTGNADSTMALWNPKTGEQICRLLSFRDGTWVVVDKDGRFDTNNLEDIKGLQWVMPDDPLTPLPLEIFMRQYYEPRLLPRLLAGDKFATVKNIAELNRVQPSVQITKIEPQQNAPDTVLVTIEVSKAEGKFHQSGVEVVKETGVYDLRLFRNGQLVGYEPGSSADNQSQGQNGLSAAEELQEWQRETRIPLDSTGKASKTFPVKLPHSLDAGRVEFSAYAFNSDKVKSATDRKTYDLSRPLKAAKGRVYLITFGVARFEDPRWTLLYPANDARSIRDTLLEKLPQTGRYDEVVPIPLISDLEVKAGETVIQPTKENVKTVFELLSGKEVAPEKLQQIPTEIRSRIRRAGPDDLVIISFSTHGEADNRGNFYLYPYDTGAGTSGAELLKHSISSIDLSLWLRDLDAGDMVMILDACHSGSAAGQEFKPGPMGSRGLGQLAYDKGMSLLAATQADNVAFGSGESRSGLLTTALIRDGLKKGEAAKDGRVTIKGWLEYGVRRVPTLYEEEIPKDRQQKEQQPVLFDFARRRTDVLVAKLAGK